MIEKFSLLCEIFFVLGGIIKLITAEILSMKDNKNYYVGLDVGSSSVGWATTDEDFNLLRIKGKTAWGARIFDEASKSADRRMKRANKRRINRRKYRIFLLNSLFNDIITKSDPSFFTRLANSTLKQEDKKDPKPSPYLFLNKQLEKDFYKIYPTIWHLRNALFEGEKNAFNDARKIYLAIHHIIKYRGNFLSEGEFKIGEFDDTTFEQINAYFQEKYMSILDLEEGEESAYTPIKQSDYISITSILEDKRNNKVSKKKKISLLVQKSGDKTVDAFINLFIELIAGSSSSLKKVLPDTETTAKIQFGKGYEDKEMEYRSLLGEDFFIVELAKRIFDHVQLKELLGEHRNISSAFISIYNRHSIELKTLKLFAKTIDKNHNLLGKNSLNFKIFKDPNNINNYAAFVAVNSLSGRSETSIHEFNAFVLNSISPYEEELKAIEGDCLTYDEVIERLNDDSFLEIIANKSTSLIPHQLHQVELEKILDNCKEYYPEIYDLKEKLLKLFTFRVPYYYGPLDSRSKYSSVVRRNNNKITPWNIEEIVDGEKTKENFINGLTNSCRFLLGETKVLPKSSILYQHFVILDRLNSIKINGQSITQEVKKDLLENLILKSKKTSISKIKKYLTSNNRYEIFKKDGISIDGIASDEFVNDSYNAFTRFFDSEKLNDNQIREADEIIYKLTIYKDDINSGVAEIKKGHKLSDKQINVLRTLQLNGWAPFSHRLLKEVVLIDDNHVAHSIFETMLDNVKNFQVTLHDKKLCFKDEIDAINSEFVSGQSADDLVENILENTPAPMRRSAIQAIRIVDEIVKFKGSEPQYISIEVTRTNDPKKKGKETTSRQKEVEDFVKSMKNDANEMIKQGYLKVVDDLTEENLIKTKGKHIYLYFKQLGFDMYTGKPISSIEDVLNGTYDIDHIVPKRLRPDDSIDNMVLVNKKDNQNTKGGIYPIPPQIRDNPEVRKLWKLLFEKKAISEKKYNSLIRSTPLSDAEVEEFVNSQINVVNQSNIVLRNVLSIKYPNVQLIFSKAQFPAYLRKHLSITKLREINDTHHAVDAYLNIVTGVLLHKRFSDKFYLKERENHFESVNMEKYLSYQMATNKLSEVVHRNTHRRDMLLTYRNTYQDDRFYKETIYKAGEKDALVPIHTKGPMKDPNKYGGYLELSNYGLVVATIKGKKIRRTLVAVPLLYSKIYSDEELKNVLAKSINLKQGESISIDTDRVILSNQKVLMNGANYLLCTKGKQINLKPISPIFLPDKTNIYLKKAQKYKEVIKNNEGESLILETKKDTGEVFAISKTENAKILNEIKNISFNKKFDSCPMITQIREYDIDLFATASLYDQLETLMSMIGLFTRNARTLSTRFTKNVFLKSQSFIDENEVYIIYDSITGLKSYKKVL